MGSLELALESFGSHFCASSTQSSFKEVFTVSSVNNQAENSEKVKMSNKLLMISPPSNSNSKPSMRSSGTSMEASQMCVTLGSEPKQRS